eukprot:g25937.t1
MCSARETTHINHTPTSSRDQPNVNIRSHIRWIQPKTLSTPKTIKTIDHHRSEGPPSRPVRLLRNSARMTPTRTGLLLATAQKHQSWSPDITLRRRLRVPIVTCNHITRSPPRDHTGPQTVRSPQAPIRAWKVKAPLPGPFDCSATPHA